MKKICIAMIAATGLAYGSNAAENLIRNGSFEDETRDWNFLSMHGIVRNLERSTVVQDGDEGLTMRFEKPADKLLNGKYGAWAESIKQFKSLREKTIWSEPMSMRTKDSPAFSPCL